MVYNQTECDSWRKDFQIKKILIIFSVQSPLKICFSKTFSPNFSCKNLFVAVSTAYTLVYTVIMYLTVNQKLF